MRDNILLYHIIQANIMIRDVDFGELLYMVINEFNGTDHERI